MLPGAGKAGLGNGLAAGLAIHWLFWAPLTELVYCMELPGLVVNCLGVAAVLALLAAVLTIGSRAVRLAGDRARTTRAALTIGAGAGLLAGLSVYFIVAVIGAWLVQSGVPLVCDMMGAIELGTAAAREALAQAACEAAPAPLLVLGACLALGGLLGGFEGLVYALFRLRQEPACEDAEAPPDGGAAGAEP